ncbi:ABC transporter ATP-binding protein [Oscillatoria amoena NRMC-F 0135]|nr:ABC transporter ATP-binding protein [Geitlerinema splendidum]MDL5046863.1 ABC transporter ATP-binding protein [Oscillatoria amoena NRMC-F 0135]
MSDTVIQVENLSKKYLIGHQKQAYTLREAISNTTRSLSHKLITPWKKSESFSQTEEFWALKDISFEVKQGDRVGIIGRNGAGKSTLLKILSRITEPTHGRITIKGRVASLLEVGTGFHGDLTGRENIFLNGAILGMSKAEIQRKFDEIVAFAEVENFLDTPVKRYSSGMYVRLAFAVAAHLEPEILVVDEVLAVGDAQFQKKCLGKMKDVSQEGRTVLFVSHSMPTITSLCQKSILLESGKIIRAGKTSDVVIHYYTNGESSPSAVNFSTFSRKVGDELAILVSGSVKNLQDEVKSELEISEPFKIIMKYQILTSKAIKFVPNFHFYTSDGACAFITNSQEKKVLKPGTYLSECYIPKDFLNEGTYFVGLALSSFDSGVSIHFFERNALSFNIKDSIEGTMTRNSYTGIFPGVVRPLLKWNIVPIHQLSERV